MESGQKARRRRCTININSFHLFCLVVEEGSISRAAKKCYISQPAVTRHIHQLEDFYGVLLFERTKGALKISKAGEVLYPYAKAIVDGFRRSEEAVKQFSGQAEVHLRIGATLTIGEYMLPKLLGQFKQRHPDIHLTLEIGNTPHMLDALMNGQIHLALIEGAFKRSKNLSVRKFAEDELVLVCSTTHPWRDREEISVHELLEEQMIWREERSGTRKIVERALAPYQAKGDIENAMEMGSTQAIKSAVEANLGVSILPKMAVEREIRSGLLHIVNIPELPLKRDLHLVQKRQRFPHAGVDMIVDFITRHRAL